MRTCPVFSPHTRTSQVCTSRNYRRPSRRHRATATLPPSLRSGNAYHTPELNCGCAVTAGGHHGGGALRRRHRHAGRHDGRAGRRPARPCLGSRRLVRLVRHRRVAGTERQIAILLRRAGGRLARRRLAACQLVRTMCRFTPSSSDSLIPLLSCFTEQAPQSSSSGFTAVCPPSRQRCAGRVALSVGLPIDGCPVFRNALCYDPCTPLAPCFCFLRILWI